MLKYAGVAAVSSSESEGRPEWTATLNVGYDVGNFGVTITGRYIGKMEIGIPGSPSNFVGRDVGHRMVYRSHCPLSFVSGSKGGEMGLFGPVNNVFDSESPNIPSTAPGTSFPTLIALRLHRPCLHRRYALHLLCFPARWVCAWRR